MCLVTVIVPVYNVESYLKRCLDSIIAQQYENFEVVLVDDGSTDQSGPICDEYCQKDQRFHVIHQANAGLSAARNTGLDRRNGIYVCFVDSDDVVSPRYISSLLCICQDHNCDIAIGQFKTFAKTISFDNQKSIEVETLTGRQMELELVGPNFISSTVACCKLFNTSVFSKLRFPQGKIHEDEATSYLYYAKANTVGRTNEVIYGYYQREGSITKSEFSHKSFDFLQIAKERAYYFCASGDEELYHHFLRVYCWGLLLFLKKSNENLKDESIEKELIREFKAESAHIKKSPYLSTRHTVILKISRVWPRLFPLMLTIREKITHELY